MSDAGTPSPNAGTPSLRVLAFVLFFLFFSCSSTASAQDAPTAPTAVAAPPAVELRLGGRDLLEGEGKTSQALKIVLGLTALSLAPALVLSASSFTRIVIVLSFVRRAIGTQSLPPNQTLVGLSLFLAAFTMWPVVEDVRAKAVEPLRKNEIGEAQALDRAVDALRRFLVERTRERDVALFVDLARIERPATPADVPLRVALPAFVVSELRTSFEMGLMIFLPFLVIDLAVASVLLSTGMMMLPPALVSTPLKLLLFVLVDGWHLVVRSLVESFR